MNTIKTKQINSRIGRKSFLVLTFRGLLILIPLAGTIYLGNQLLTFVRNFMDGIISKSVIQTRGQAFLAVLLAIIVILLISYIIGYISRTDQMIQIMKKLDEFLINTSDWYRNIKLKFDNDAQFLVEDKPAIYVRFGESERPGFLMEESKTDGKCIVFIPKNFNNYDGNIYLVPKENIRYSKMDDNDFIYSMDHLGTGLEFE